MFLSVFSTTVRFRSRQEPALTAVPGSPCHTQSETRTPQATRVLCSEGFTHRTDRHSLLVDLALSGNMYDLYDLYDLAHVTGWKPYNLHVIARASWVGSVLYGPRTKPHYGRLGSR